MHKVLPLLFILLLCTCDRAPEIVPLDDALVLPQPQQQTDRTGHFAFEPGLTISVENDGQAAQLAGFLAEFSAVSGWQPTVVTGGEGRFRLSTVPAIAAEGYILYVSPAAIDLQAATNAGFFYGLQTLRQLFPSAFFRGEAQPDVTWSIPSVEIEDAPAFGWRGFMLDVSRHFFTVEQVKDVLDLMAEQKLNRFHWHLTDDQGWRIELKSYPKLTSVGAWRADRTNPDEREADWWGRTPLQPGEQPTYGGFYTQEEVREIIAYAQARHIEIIPEIDMPGHSQAAVAAYPEIGCVNAAPAVATGGVYRNNTLNPGKEATYAFAEAVLNELMDIFPFEYVHIGGDECNKEQWKIDPAAQRKMREEGLKSEEELQSYFIKRMEQIINARGRKMIGWDEILEGGLAPNAVVMSWRGEAGGIASVQAGHEVIMTPNKYCYLDLKQGHDDLEPNLGYSKLLLSTAYNYQVIPDTMTSEQARLIKGIQANMWTESLSDWSKFTYMLYPRLFAVAENAWTLPQDQDWDHFVTRVLQANERLTAQNIRYAVSAFSPWLHHERSGNQLRVWFTTEVNNVAIRYTLDGSVPTVNAKRYEGPILVGPGEQVTAQSFLNEAPIGYPVSLDLPVHLAAGMSVVDAQGTPLPALTDLQYARLTSADSNWVKLPNQTVLTLTFDQPTEVSSLRFSALKYSISGIYAPQEVEVQGAFSVGGTFLPLATTKHQMQDGQLGRDKIVTRLSFSPLKLAALQLRIKTFDQVPADHQKVGTSPRMYLDELVVE